MHDKLIKLKDGRTLAFHEFGDLAGKPVLLFHGWPSSGLVGESLDSAAKNLKLRIITPDRTGIGQSSDRVGRKLLDYPDDIEELLDWLGLFCGCKGAARVIGHQQSLS